MKLREFNGGATLTVSRHHGTILVPVHGQREVEKIGAHVRSHFRARWFGVVIGHADQGHRCVWVRITHDRTGRPIRKPGASHNVHMLGSGWLVIEEPSSAAIRYSVAHGDEE